MPELSSLMGDLPEDLQPTAATGAAVDDDAPAGSEDSEEEEVTTPPAGEEEEDQPGGDSEDEEEAPTGTPPEDEDDDYVTDLEDEEEKPTTPSASVAETPPAKPPMTDENTFILNGLPKITVNVVVPSADGKSQETKEFQVYGWGDLPRNMLGFASPYEQGVFTASAQNNELKARELQTQYRQEKVRADTEVYTLKENKAIARDLRSLREDGVFPKFKGVPGSKEFNDSEGAKEFDRVIAYMNEQNDIAGQAAQNGEAFFHISFKQAFQMLHGTKGQEKAKQEQQARRAAAGKLKPGNGAKPNERNVQTKRVSNITDLAGEFEQFVGSGAAK